MMSLRAHTPGTFVAGCLAIGLSLVLAAALRAQSQWRGNQPPAPSSAGTSPAASAERWSGQGTLAWQRSPAERTESFAADQRGNLLADSQTDRKTPNIDPASADAPFSRPAAARGYRGSIIARRAAVRSGPGADYYVTQDLLEGEEVEVYGSQRGWLAIRPPRQSFSWVRRDALRRDADGAIVVDGDRVVSQIGSEQTPDRDVWQVELRQGEEVDVLGSDPDSDEWVRIAPPSGEFRWVDERNVRPIAGSEFDLPSPGDASDADDRAVSSPEVDDVNFRLTQAVSESAGIEELERIYERAQAVLDRAQSRMDRGAAQRMADRAATFLDLARRRERLARRESAGGPAGETARLAQSGRRFEESSPLDDARDRRAAARELEGGESFDAVGILMPVTTGRAGVPQYALLDESGKLAFYVTPSAGLRLQAFEGRQVGVMGNRAYAPDLNALHVTARQVQAVDGTIRR